MNRCLITLVSLCLTLCVEAQVKRAERRSLLDSDPEVVYLEYTLKDPIHLDVIKEAPVFSEKGGTHRIGYLRANQRVKLEAITEKAYRVRGEGRSGGIVGWVGPWAFSSKDPQFVENLKKLYTRQMEVQNLIAAKAVAVGMTIDEVGMSLGKPTKTSMRRTAKGEAGTWEFIEYEEVKHYITRIDPVSGGIFRQLSHITQEEKSKTAVEFENGLVSAVTESESRKGGGVRIIVPPLIFGW